MSSASDGRDPTTARETATPATNVAVTATNDCCPATHGQIAPGSAATCCCERHIDAGGTGLSRERHDLGREPFRPADELVSRLALEEQRQVLDAELGKGPNLGGNLLTRTSHRIGP